jgi:hypothetical protein
VPWFLVGVFALKRLFIERRERESESKEKEIDFNFASHENKDMETYVVDGILIRVNRLGGCLLCAVSLVTKCMYVAQFGASFSAVKLINNFDKNGLGSILGDFCTNSSGHTDLDLQDQRTDVCD